MWTIYDIHRDLYWNAQYRRWCAREEASLYSLAERDRVPLRSLEHQWRYVMPGGRLVSRGDAAP